MDAELNMQYYDKEIFTGGGIKGKFVEIKKNRICEGE